MTSTATATRTTIQVNESRSFDAGHHVVSVYRKSDTCYRVTVVKAHVTVPCYSAEFDHLLNNLPIGDTGRSAAWTYMQALIAEFTADAERPTDVAARTATDYAIADLARLTNAQQAALATADPTGLIRHGNGVTVATLRALARTRLGTLTYRTQGMRRSVSGVQLGTHGRRLAAHVQTINATAVAA